MSQASSVNAATPGGLPAGARDRPGAGATELAGGPPADRPGGHSSGARRSRWPGCASLTRRAARPATASALILAGNETSRHPAGPFSLVEVVRAAISEIEDYDRITLHIQQGVSVSGSAAADTVHLLAELVENATAFSAPVTQVTMSGRAVRDGGARITITDSGPGMSGEQLSQLNWRLAHPPAADVASSWRWSFAVAHLAARHGITVVLSQPPDSGTTAEVYLPTALICTTSCPAAGCGRLPPLPWRRPASGPTAGPRPGTCCSQLSGSPRSPSRPSRRKPAWRRLSR